MISEISNGISGKVYEIWQQLVTPCRKDRNSRGGGVMLAVSNKLFSKLLPTPDNLELLALSLNHNEYIICLLYIPPSSNDQYHCDVQNYLLSLSNYNNLLVFGDVNFPDINWNDYSASNSVSVTFCDIIFYLNLTQLVMKPTHVHGNILDVVLSNFDLSDGPNIIDKLPLGLSSDHHIICFSISDIARTHTVSAPKVLFDYSKADWNSMNLFF